MNCCYVLAASAGKKPVLSPVTILGVVLCGGSKILDFLQFMQSLSLATISEPGAGILWRLSILCSCKEKELGLLYCSEITSVAEKTNGFICIHFYGKV